MPRQDADDKVIFLLKQKLSDAEEKHREATASVRKYLSALSALGVNVSSEVVPADSSGSVSDGAGLSKTQKIRKIYCDFPLDTEFDTQTVLRIYKERYPLDLITRKSVSSLLGREAQNDRLEVVRPFDGSAPALYKRLNQEKNQKQSSDWVDRDE